MAGPTVSNALWYAGIALEAILLARLWRLELLRRYALLSAYLAFVVLRGGALVWLRDSDVRLFGLKGYGIVFVATQPLVWVLYFLLILEFYSQMLEEFPGIRRLGRLVLFSALASVAGACVVLMVVDRQAGYDRYPFLSRLVLEYRSVSLSLGILALMLLLFVGYYRLTIRRNVWVLYAAFAGYFLASALLYTLRRHLGEQFRPLRDQIGPAFYILALLSAILLLSEAGETECRPISALWGRRNGELEAALSSQLQNFNRMLAKVLRT